MPSVVIIIPCFNEAAIIASSLIRLAQDLSEEEYAEWNIVCVDDGSTDETSKIIAAVQAACESSRVRVQLVTLERNQGKGAAIQAGLRAGDADHYGYMDADLSINYKSALSEIVKLLATHDVVIGRRTQKRASGYTMFRTIASSLFSWVAFRIFKLPSQDVQCGFKFFTHTAKPVALAVGQPKFSFDLEFLSRAQSAGHTIHEIPVTWQHKQQSSVRLVDGIRYLQDAVRVLRQK
jgi:dolichol-phosphate mannosyltransferase